MTGEKTGPLENKIFCPGWLDRYRIISWDEMGNSVGRKMVSSVWGIWSTYGSGEWSSCGISVWSSCRIGLWCLLPLGKMGLNFRREIKFGNMALGVILRENSSWVPSIWEVPRGNRKLKRKAKRAAREEERKLCYVPGAKEKTYREQGGHLRCQRPQSRKKDGSREVGFRFGDFSQSISIDFGRINSSTKLFICVLF